MKKFKISYLWLLMLLTLIGACSKEDIVFDVELPRFELRPGYQLLEEIGRATCRERVFEGV